MARSPFPQDNDPAQALRTLIGRAGLNSLMQDPRYWDANHPDHNALVDMMHAGFGLVFGKPGDGMDGQLRGPAPAPTPEPVPVPMPRPPASNSRYVPVRASARPAPAATARDPFAESFTQQCPTRAASKTCRPTRSARSAAAWCWTRCGHRAIPCPTGSTRKRGLDTPTH